MKKTVGSLIACLIAVAIAITLTVTQRPVPDCTTFANEVVYPDMAKSECGAIGAPVKLGKSFGIEVLCQGRMERHLYLDIEQQGGKDAVESSRIPHKLIGRCKADTGAVFDLYIFTYTLNTMKG